MLLSGSGNSIGVYISSSSDSIDTPNNTTLTVSGNPVIIAETSTSESYGIYNTTGTLTLGSDDGSVSTTSPSITGGTNGVLVSSTGTFNFYDGIITGGLYNSSNKGAIDATIADKPDGYGVYYLTKDNCEVATLKQGLLLNYDSSGYTSASTNSPWYNRSQNLYHGTLKNGITWSDNGLVFDGIDDWVNTGLVDETAKINRTYSVTFSVPSFKTENTENDLIGNWNGGGGGIMLASNAIGSSLFLSGSSSTNLGDSQLDNRYEYCITTVVPEYEKKYNVILTYDGNYIKLYINGEFIKSSSNVPGSIGMPVNEAAIILGANSAGRDLCETGSTYNFKGTIYSAHVFDKALTQEEVTELYNSEKAKGR